MGSKAKGFGLEWFGFRVMDSFLEGFGIKAGNVLCFRKQEARDGDLVCIKSGARSCYFGLYQSHQDTRPRVIRIGGKRDGEIVKVDPERIMGSAVFQRGI